MDVISHALWAAAAGAWIHRRGWASTPVAAAGVALAIAPDVVQMLPVVAWGATQPEPLAFLYAHVSATPGTEPDMPAAAHAWSHHLHCVFHSIIVAGVATAVVAALRRPWLAALAGWWLHIAMDIPTHSRDYYAVPVFYPLSYWGFDGIDWTTPWVIGLNYGLLAAACGWLWHTRRGPTGRL
jgi:hypothetical protein